MVQRCISSPTICKMSSAGKRFDITQKIKIFYREGVLHVTVFWESAPAVGASASYVNFFFGARDHKLSRPWKNKYINGKKKPSLEQTAIISKDIWSNQSKTRKRPSASIYELHQLNAYLFIVIGRLEISVGSSCRTNATVCCAIWNHEQSGTNENKSQQIEKGLQFMIWKFLKSYSFHHVGKKTNKQKKDSVHKVRSLKEKALRFCLQGLYLLGRVSVRVRILGLGFEFRVVALIRRLATSIGLQLCPVQEWCFTCVSGYCVHQRQHCFTNETCGHEKIIVNVHRHVWKKEGSPEKTSKG